MGEDATLRVIDGDTTAVAESYKLAQPRPWDEASEGLRSYRRASNFLQLAPAPRTAGVFDLGGAGVLAAALVRGGFDDVRQHGAELRFSWPSVDT
ncbi:MAG: hypothetical protein M3Q48_16515 [Actinomycetota bacterium]|nr:hypothetical protein [Actinomycetota bacterium]